MMTTNSKERGTGLNTGRCREERNTKTARLCVAGLMIALAFILSYIESLLPSFTGVPGVKAGLANIVTMVALYSLGWQYAAIISLVRVVLSGLIFTGMSAMLYSLAGAVLSLTIMILLRSVKALSASPESDTACAPGSDDGRTFASDPPSLPDLGSGRTFASDPPSLPDLGSGRRFAPIFSLPAVSVAGGVAHNIGQILVAWAVLGSAVLYYLPVLIISGLIAGIITGVIAALVCRNIKCSFLDTV